VARLVQFVQHFGEQQRRTENFEALVGIGLGNTFNEREQDAGVRQFDDCSGVWPCNECGTALDVCEYGGAFALVVRSG